MTIPQPQPQPPPQPPPHPLHSVPSPPQTPQASSTAVPPQTPAQSVVAVPSQVPLQSYEAQAQLPALQVAGGVHVPQDPPQPSSPHDLPAQFGVQHCPFTQTEEPGQPQLRPHSFVYPQPLQVSSLL